VQELQAQLETVSNKLASKVRCECERCQSGASRVTARERDCEAAGSAGVCERQFASKVSFLLLEWCYETMTADCGFEAADSTGDCERQACQQGVAADKL